MAPEYRENYKSMLPEPWPSSQASPEQDTAEVLEKWQESSKPRGEHPCRKIVFTMRSRDQGWGGGAGRGSYENSSTWFDVGLEKVSAFRERKFLYPLIQLC